MLGCAAWDDLNEQKRHADIFFNSSFQFDKSGLLDYQWVVRWLDDVGLPQYKDRFLESRLDGRMLHLITVNDLFQMRITNMLHHLSIKSGIQVLRSRFGVALVMVRELDAKDQEDQAYSWPFLFPLKSKLNIDAP